MRVLCHACEGDCTKRFNEMMTELGWEEYECTECGERFLVPMEEFKVSQN